MGTLDIILLICFVPALVRGIMKGFVEQLISLASIFVGAWMAYRFAEPLSVWLTQFINVEPRILGVASFAIIVIISIFLLALLGKLLAKTLSLASLGFVDKLLGVVFALLKAALIIGLLIFVFDTFNTKWNIVNPEVLDGSVIYGALHRAAMKVFPYLQNLLNL